MRFGKKLHGNRKFARGEAECYLNCCKCNFFPKLHSVPWDYLLIVMTYSTFTKPKRSLLYNLKVDPVLFQVNSCNFKNKIARSPRTGFVL